MCLVIRKIRQSFNLLYKGAPISRCRFPQYSLHQLNEIQEGGGIQHLKQFVSDNTSLGVRRSASVPISSFMSEKGSNERLHAHEMSRVALEHQLSSSASYGLEVDEVPHRGGPSVLGDEAVGGDLVELFGTIEEEYHGLLGKVSEVSAVGDACL